MWVNNSSRWHKDTTKSEKFFLQKVIQRCDFDEIISKRHKTTNGYVLVKEMLNLVRLTELRGRSIKTLIVLGGEAKSQYLSQNIINDPIICKYFLDLKKFILDFKFDSLQSNREPNLIKLKEFKHQISLFNIQLDKYYHQSIVKEIEEIEFNENAFYRSAERLENLIDIYLTFLIYNGYSASSITGYLLDWLIKEKHFKISNFCRFFNLHDRAYRYYLALDEINKDTTDFAQLLRANYKIKVQKIGDNSVIDNQLGKRSYIVFEAPSRDMNSFTRNLYDQLLKELVVKRDRHTLNFFNSFFEETYWSHTNSTKINQINLAGDPINVKGRERTLLSTLKELKFIKSSEKRELPPIKDDKLYNAVYYYLSLIHISEPTRRTPISY